MVGQRRDDAAMEMAEELAELGPLRQRHRHLARLGGDDAYARRLRKAGQVHDRSKLLDTVRPAHVRIPYAGIRTGSCSMPRTKLE